MPATDDEHVDNLTALAASCDCASVNVRSALNVRGPPVWAGSKHFARPLPILIVRSLAQVGQAMSVPGVGVGRVVRRRVQQEINQCGHRRIVGVMRSSGLRVIAEPRHAALLVNVCNGWERIPRTWC
jgi:hypothetical protein